MKRYRRGWLSSYRAHRRLWRKSYGRKSEYHRMCAMNTRFKNRKLTNQEKKHIWNTTH